MVVSWWLGRAGEQFRWVGSMAVIADIGAVLRLTPQDDLHIASRDGVYDSCDDQKPFDFRVKGHLYDGQLFYGVFGPVLSGPSRYEGLICNILVRTDAADWRKETRSQVNFKVGPGVVTRDHRHHFGHRDGTSLEGFPRISRFGLVEVVNARPSTHPPTIELDGARLRPLNVPDSGALYAYLRDLAVTELTSYPAVSMPMVEAMIDRSMSRWAAGELGKWGIALPQDDQLIGTCGFNELSPVHRWAELGFDLARSHWGKGLMRQAVAAVLEWTFRQDQVDRVHAYVRVDNRRSWVLLERGGFVREGCLRSYRVCRGQPHDFLIYAFLRSDWEVTHELDDPGARIN
jgi:RimJ/RimL family protein N-acetyltransferase